MGYDFHLAQDGPRLIEINSNAGGAFLNAALARAHRASCEPVAPLFAPPNGLPHLDDVFLAMFRVEWRAQRGDMPGHSVVIADDAPETQYLAPEFQMARALFAAHGLVAVVADPRTLQWRDGALWHPTLPAGMPVDLVYNRLTDFYLQDIGHGDLLGLLAGALWGLTTVVIRATGLTRISAEKLLFYQVAFTGVALRVVSLAMGEVWTWDWGPFAWLSVAVQTCVGAFARYLAWMWMLGHYPSTKISAFVFLTPLFALLFGSLMLGEAVTATLLLSMALVAGGIVLVNRRPG